MQEITPQEEPQADVEALLLRIAAGDGSALEPLYTKIRPGVYGFALSITRSVQDAEDVLQDTILRVCEAAPRYRPNGRPMPWILTITKNFALMKLRENGRADMLPFEDWEQLTAHLPRVTPEDRVVLYAAAEKSVKRLPAGQTVDAGPELIVKLEKSFGEGNVKVVEKRIENIRRMQ